MEPTRVPVKIITKSGSRVKSQVYIVNSSKDNGSDDDMLFWRSDVGLNVLLIENLQLEEAQLIVYFPPNFELKLEFLSNEAATDFYDLLNSILHPNNESKNTVDEEVAITNNKSKLKFTLGRQISQFNANRMLENHLPIEIAFLLENGYQNIAAINFNDGALILEPFLLRIVKQLLKNRFNKWAQYTKQINNQAMMNDRKRWRYHAIVNQDIDLQAWYHAVFYKEVYRPRGQFWYRDAVLPIYRNSYDLVDNTLSPMEEAALAHVLCSPETSYGDVAGQMFVVQSIVKKPQLFTMFQKLSAQGATVIKFPKTGNPSKKLFRFSFVEGNIYLTWKGKYGNQGVDLADVTAVNIGISTDTLKKAYTFAMNSQQQQQQQQQQQNKSTSVLSSPVINSPNSDITAVSTTTPTTNTTTTTPISLSTAASSSTVKVEDLYLSIISGGKSIDLCLPTVEDRNDWKELLEVLTRKENGVLSEEMDPLVTPRVVVAAVREDGEEEVLSSSLGNNNNYLYNNDNNIAADSNQDNNYNTSKNDEAQARNNKNNNDINNTSDSFEWLLWYSSLGEKVLPIPVRQTLYNNNHHQQQQVKDRQQQQQPLEKDNLPLSQTSEQQQPSGIEKQYKATKAAGETDDEELPSQETVEPSASSDEKLSVSALTISNNNHDTIHNDDPIDINPAITSTTDDNNNDHAFKSTDNDATVTGASSDDVTVEV